MPQHKHNIWKSIITILRKLGIVSYPYLDIKCEFGGKRPGTRVKHKDYGLGETLCFAEYHERSEDYFQRVLFDSERENGSYIDRFILWKELELAEGSKYGT